MAKKKHTVSNDLEPSEACQDNVMAELQRLGSEIAERERAQNDAPPEDAADDEDDLSRARGPDWRGIEMSGASAAPTAAARMAAARNAKVANGTAKPRNPPQYLVLGQRREDGEYDVLAVRKSRRGAVKFATETRGLIRRSYLGVTVMRSKIVHMEGF